MWPFSQRQDVKQNASSDEYTIATILKDSTSLICRSNIELQISQYYSLAIDYNVSESITHKFIIDAKKSGNFDGESSKLFLKELEKRMRYKHYLAQHGGIFYRWTIGNFWWVLKLIYNYFLAK